MLVYLTIALAGVVCWLSFLLARQPAVSAQAARAAVFDGCIDLIDSPHVTPGREFGVLRGNFEGLPIKAALLADTLAVRKLPALWLMIDVVSPLVTWPVIDFLIRPSNTEFWSPAWALEHELIIPESWPQHALLRTESPEVGSRIRVLDRHIVAFDDERMKELLITPRGVRLVYLADEGRRAHYGVLRQARFDGLPLARDLLARLLGLATALHRDLRTTNFVCAPTE